MTTGLLISDFNVETLSTYLNFSGDAPQLNCKTAPYGQVAQVLLDGNQSCWESKPDFTVVWTRPEQVLESFARVVSGIPVDSEMMQRDVDEYCQTLLLAKSRTRVIFVPTWIFPALHSGHGLLDFAPGIGPARLLMEANFRLLDNLEGNANVFPLNSSKWVELAGGNAFNPRLWYSSKTPFGNDLFKAAVRDFKSALRGIAGRARKLVILDLDDTLWGGILGDIGSEKLLLGGHDPIGEALVDFQHELKGLSRRGVILAVVSKNEEAVALDALRNHPEMVLQVDDLAGWRINWQDKAQNIVELCEELNLGLDSAVFIDDNPVERARVRDALPSVLVPNWPEDKRLYTQELRKLECFDRPALSDEDRQRAGMYTTERKRNQLKSQVTSVEEWLHTLDTTAYVRRLNNDNLARTAQLLNKTNQMNLSTRRLTEEELGAWATAPDHSVWVFHVSDKFGDSGLAGVLSLDAAGGRVQIVDFLLSCRVMGRQIEETMLHFAVEWARSIDAAELYAVYMHTAKNRPCLEFFKRSGLRSDSERLFVWNVSQTYPAPTAVRVLRESRSPTHRTCAAESEPT